MAILPEEEDMKVAKEDYSGRLGRDRLVLVIIAEEQFKDN